ncbi:MAG: hypothetical protein IJV46_01485 [Acidaminococcaceae bacterium]|nr:hypothetical protein [Acidaminococcaceae bacterium]
MKFWKKLLIGVIILTLIGICGFVGLGIFGAKKVYTEKIEPDMKRYVTMTQQEQDEYVLSKLEDLYGLSNKLDDSAEGKAALNALQNDPAVRQAGLVWGRSLCAFIIKESSDISAALSPEEREKYEKEARDFDDKSDRFQKEMERVVPKKK